MNNRIGLHWIRTHPDNNRDYAFVKALKPASIKLFLPAWTDRDFCNGLLAAAPPACIFVARDHELSEQKEDMWKDPEGTGRRHAEEWLQKIAGGQYHLPPERSCFLGINEPDATHGDRTAIDIYTENFLNRLARDHQTGGAFNFSTGHPRTIDGTGNTAPDYAFFERSHQAIVRGHHFAIQHIYGAASQPLVPGHYDRLRSCPWQDVTWIIGECGIDEHVITGGNHDGYLVSLHPHDRYPGWIEELIRGLGDTRIHSWQPFTYDFTKPWGSFDVSAVNDAFIRWNWRGLEDTHLPTPPPTQPQPGPTPPSDARLVHPVAGAPISQRFGENPAKYARFEQAGHNGTDFGAASGTPVLATANGRVEMVDMDVNYGWYCRISHPALHFYSFYAHMIEKPSVSIGQDVRGGDVVGKVGSTGNSTGPHLHYECRLMQPGGAYGKAQFGYTKGRVDPETVFSVLGGKL